jgi:hypothetical protein
MKTKSGKGNLVRISAAELPAATAEELDALERAMEGPIDTSEIPERRTMKRHGPIWNAIVGEMHRRGMSGHGLWKLAREHCPRIPESAVYEFMADKRSVRVEYADAMLMALDVRLAPARRRRAG